MPPLPASLPPAGRALPACKICSCSHGKEASASAGGGCCRILPSYFCLHPAAEYAFCNSTPMNVYGMFTASLQIPIVLMRLRASAVPCLPKRSRNRIIRPCRSVSNMRSADDEPYAAPARRLSLQTLSVKPHRGGEASPHSLRHLPALFELAGAGDQPDLRFSGRSAKLRGSGRKVPSRISPICASQSALPDRHSKEPSCPERACPQS